MAQTPPTRLAALVARAGPHRGHIALALVSIAICVTVMIGWKLGLETVVRLSPTLSPMQFNTALALALVGIGAIAGSLRYRLVAGVLAGAGAGIAALNLLEIATGVRLPLDELFHAHQFVEPGAIAGRMSPNSALAILLMGLTVFVPQIRLSGRPIRGAAIAAFMFSAAAIGAIAASVIGYLIGAAEVFGFVPETRMGVLTTIAATCLAVPICESMLAALLRRRRLPVAGLLAGFGLALGIVLASAHGAIREDAQNARRAQLDLELGYVARQLSGSIADRVLAMERMAQRWGRVGGLSEENWRADALRYASDYRMIQAVSWAGTDGILAWVEPLAGNEEAVGLDLFSFPDRRAVYERARDSGRTVATPVLDFVQGGRGFITMSPVYVRNGEFDGVMNAVFVLSEVVSAMPVSPVLGEAELLLADTTTEMIMWDQVQVLDGTFFVGIGQDAAAVLQPRQVIADLVLVLGLISGGLALLASAALLRSLAQNRQIAQTNRDLEQANSELDSFAYLASHDLKSPMRGIRQLADWLEQDMAANLSEEARRYLGLIHSRIGRLQDLLDALLEFSRVGRNAMVLQSVDVLEEVRRAVALQDLPETWTVDIRGDRLEARVDKNLLLVIVANLVRNAVKHHDREAGHLQVVLTCDVDDWTLAVIDDGPGIPREKQERVFEMFQTLKAKDVVEGSGMGLAIVSKAVARLDGDVHVESDPSAGRGSRFIVRCPLVVREADASQS
ncbi:sensor histidine kinase [Maricaulis maris]|uniref:histidine kinase n=1 Tax=Maricaulis maris TaxID=74318 RepID=A0A495D186_9PROT|nr:ATP-binding protein [Maricaulis maris]RKQ95223.1 phospho-acceptor domain-containing protein [Maricaulis maris]